MHDETFRMLGAAHEADLERDARKWQRAAEARRVPRAPASGLSRRMPRLVSLRLVRFLARYST
jgi:hypothetical protein